MKNAIEGWFGAEAWENVIVTRKQTQLLEVHVFVGTADVLRIQVLQRAEQFTHEVDHHAVVDQVYQLANLVALRLLHLIDTVVEGKYEILDETPDCLLAFVDFWVHFWSHFDEKCHEAGEVKFVQVRVGTRTCG